MKNSQSIIICSKKKTFLASHRDTTYIDDRGESDGEDEDNWLECVPRWRYLWLRRYWRVIGILQVLARSAMRLKRGGRDFVGVGHLFYDWAVERMKCRILATGKYCLKYAERHTAEWEGILKKAWASRATAGCRKSQWTTWMTHTCDINDDHWGRNWGRKLAICRVQLEFGETLKLNIK